ncbi:MAG: Gfo/Idh/MocA family oxidoreductase [Sedimentisphaerales bacterium]|nr:Gfo/Idh/MocA family oxidoreductase [Sedimentisphaerales bacterium]
MSKPKKNNPQNDAKFSRRQFIRGTTAAAAAFTIVPRHVLGGTDQTPPSEKINIAVIGTGGQGITNIKALLGEPDTHIVAICDVNEQSDYSAFYYGGTAGWKSALEVMEKDYLQKNPNGTYPGCPHYEDFREMFNDRDDIDAVLIATPDHVHSVATMAAIKNRKHIYCEKPLTHSIYETRMVTEAAKKSGLATQMGNQGHSGQGIRLTVEWIRDGAIGEVNEVHVWSTVSGRDWTKFLSRPEDTPPVPRGLNWDLWLGPAQPRTYHPAYAPYNWRGWWDFGTGAIGDMACHNFDPAFWALDLGHPETVEASSSKLNPESVPTACLYRYKFPAKNGRGPVYVTWYDGGLMPPRPEELEPERKMGDNGILFVGSKGKILAPGWGGTPRIIPETKMQAYQRPPKTIPRTKGHHRSWLDACKGGIPASSNFDYAGPLTETVLLGNVALRTGKKLYWDGPSMKATNAPEADQFIKPQFRPGWTL